MEAWKYFPILSKNRKCEKWVSYQDLRETELLSDSFRKRQNYTQVSQTVKVRIDHFLFGLKIFLGSTNLYDFGLENKIWLSLRLLRATLQKV